MCSRTFLLSDLNLCLLIEVGNYTGALIPYIP